MTFADEREGNRREIDAKARMIGELGDTWFNLKDDIKPEELGKYLKTYEFDLGYQDRFIVEAHENGARMTYTPTGTVHYTKKKGMAFNIGLQMKKRALEANRLLGT